MKKKNNGTGDAIADVMEVMQKNMNIANDPKTKYFEMISSWVFLISPPILLVLAVFQAISIGWSVQTVFLIIASILIIVGFGWYLYKESFMWMLFKRN